MQHIELDAEVTIANAADLATRLTAAIADGDVTLACDGVRKIDIAGLQILAAAAASAAGFGTALTLAPADQPVLTAALTRAGLSLQMAQDPAHPDGPSH